MFRFIFKNFFLKCFILFFSFSLSLSSDSLVVEDISCDDVKPKEIDYENMTIDEINLILKENFEKNLNQSDSSCVNIKSKKASGKSSSASSGVAVNISESSNGDNYLSISNFGDSGQSIVSRIRSITVMHTY